MDLHFTISLLKASMAGGRDFHHFLIKARFSLSVLIYGAGLPLLCLFSYPHVLIKARFSLLVLIQGACLSLLCLFSCPRVLIKARFSFLVLI